MKVNTNYYQVIEDSYVPVSETTMTSSSGDATVTFQMLLDSIAGERPIKVISSLPEIYGKICVHHNDEERKNVECPICLRNQLDAALDAISVLKNSVVQFGRQLGKTEFTKEFLQKHRERWAEEYNKVKTQE